MSLISSMQLASFRDRYISLQGRAGKRARQRTLHQIIWLAQTTTVNKSCFLWIYTYLLYMDKLEPMACPHFFSVSLCTGGCSFRVIICTAKRHLSCLQFWGFMKLQYPGSSQQSLQLLQKYSCCCFAVLWGVMYLPAHIVVCTCSNEMSIKYIWEEYILIFKSQRVRMGRNQLSKGEHYLFHWLVFPEAPQVPASSGCEKDPLLLTGVVQFWCQLFPRSSIHLPVAVLVYFHSQVGRTASWFCELCWEIQTMDFKSECLMSTKKRNTWTNSLEKKSLNILMCKSQFIPLEILCK